MITPLNYQAPNTNYDPLATQFMTGGQMGYMPQAQFLTSSDYGAFRTVPQVSQHVMPQQQSSLWQNYLIANKGNLFGMTSDYMMDTYNLGVDQSMYQAMARRRVQDATGVMGATAAGFGINTAISMGLGAVHPGLGFAYELRAPDLIAPISDRTRQRRNIQQMSMPKIFAGSEVVSGLGQGFSLSAAGKIDEFTRREAAGDVFFKEEDYRKITEMGVQNGLFDYANSSGEYKRTIKKLRDNINSMGEVLGSTDFKELFSGMKRLMSMGAEVNQMQGITHSEKMFSRMTGLSHSDMVSTYGQQGALSFSQKGLTGYQGSLFSGYNAAGIALSQRLGLLNAGTVARHGGVSGMAQDQTSSQADNFNTMARQILPALANGDYSGLAGNADEMISRLMSGDNSIETIMSTSGRRLNRAGEMAKYLGSEGDLKQQLLDKLGPAGYDLLERGRALHLGRKGGAENDTEALDIGYSMLYQHNKELGAQKAKQMGDKDFLSGLKSQYETQLRKMRYSAIEQYKNERSFPNRWGVFWNETFNTMAAPFKEWVEEWGRDSQFEEDKELGVLTTVGPGPKTIGLDSMTGKQRDALFGAMEVEGVKEIPSVEKAKELAKAARTKEREYKAETRKFNEKDELYAAVVGVDTKSDHYQAFNSNIKNALDVWDESKGNTSFNYAQNKYGLDSSDINKLAEKINTIEDLKPENMAKIIQDNILDVTGNPYTEEEIADLRDNKLIQGLLANIAANNPYKAKLQGQLIDVEKDSEARVLLIQEQQEKNKQEVEKARQIEKAAKNRQRLIEAGPELDSQEVIYKKMGMEVMGIWGEGPLTPEKLLWKGKALETAAKTSLSAEENEALMQKFSGKFTGADLDSSLRGAFDEATDISKPKMIEVAKEMLARNNPDLDEDNLQIQAEKLVDDDDFQKVVFNHLKKTDKNLKMDITETYKEAAGEAYGDNYEKWNEFMEDYHDKIEDFAGDRENTAVYDQILETNPQAIKLMEMQTAISSSRNKGLSKEEEQEIHTRYAELAGKAGLPSELAEKAYESAGGLADIKEISELAKSMGIKDELFDKSMQVAITKGKDIDSFKELEDHIYTADEIVYEGAAAYEHRQQTQIDEILKKQGYSAYELGSKDKLEKIKQSDAYKDNKQFAAIVDSAQGLVNSDSEVSTTTLSSRLTFDQIKPMEKQELIEGAVHKEGESGAYNQLNSTLGNLNTILYSVDGAVKELTKVAKEQVEEMRYKGPSNTRTRYKVD